MNHRNLLVLACAGLLGLLGALAPKAKADVWNQKTTFTFNAPVEIPGQVLSPGTYVFKLADSQADRNIVQVYNKDETHLYGTFLAIPDYHLRPAGRPIITFAERAAGAPEAVKAWFYPGDNYGHEFVYPKTKALELAKANNQPVASMPNEMAANTKMPATTMHEPHVMAMKQAPLKAEQSNQQEVEISEAFPPAQSTNQSAQSATQRHTTESAANRRSTANHETANQQTAANRPATLPKTASPLPLVALIGLVSLSAAGGVRFVRAALNQKR